MSEARIKNMVDIIMKLLILVPLILGIVTGILVNNAHNKIKNSSLCTGTIVGIYENDHLISTNRDKNKMVAPIVSYTVDGKTYEFIANYYSTTMKPGQQVKVLYNNTDHSVASLQTGVYFAPIITGILTVVFILPPVIYFTLKAKGII